MQLVHFCSLSRQAKSAEPEFLRQHTSSEWDRLPKHFLSVKLVSYAKTGRTDRSFAGRAPPQMLTCKGMAVFHAETPLFVNSVSTVLDL